MFEGGERVTSVTSTLKGRTACTRIAVPPRVPDYGKPSLLPNCAVEPYFWSGGPDVARQADAGFWVADVSLAGKPSRNPNPRNRCHRWLLAGLGQDFGDRQVLNV